MKITTILLFSACLTASAGGLAQKVTLSVKNVKLEKVFKEIKKQTGYVFFYDTRVLQNAKRVSVSAKNESVDDVLKESLQGQPIDFSIERKTITIFEKAGYSLNRTQANFTTPIVAVLPPIPVSIISGLVKDAQGNPLTGVSVIVRGTTKGTSTNTNGSFSVDANVGDVLEFTMVGYQKKSFTVGQSKSINVVMELEVSISDEIVVVGYGTQRRSDLTGAIGLVDIKEMNKRSVATLDQALQGQVAGVDVTSNSGSPGSSVMVRIRGIGTLNNSNPLYVVDGMMIGSIDFLNMNDIESVQVLKDASATAIYGSRGANGVIIITTKKGKKGESGHINISSYYGIQDLWKSNNIMDGPTWGSLKNEAVVAAGNQPLFNNPSELPTYNYFDAISNNHAPISDLSVSVSGGTEKGDYFFSFARFNQEGIIKKTGFDRLTLRSNSSYNIKPWLKVGENLALTRTSMRPQYENDEWTSMMITPFMRDPVTPVKNDDGSFTAGTYNDAFNPAAVIEYSNGKSGFYSTIGNLFAELELTKGLTLKSSYSFEYSFGEWDDYIPVYFVFALQKNDVSKIIKSNSSNFTRQWSNTLQYDGRIGEHNLSLLVGAETFKADSKSNGMSVNNVPNDNPEIRFIDNALGRNSATVNGSISQFRLLSGLARINYSYRDRYLFTTNFRADASSKFIDSKHQWGYFPSFSVGWKISEESFMSHQTNISNLKLRAGWGQIGNEASVPPYQYVATASPGTNYLWGGVLMPGFSFRSAANPELKWEVSSTTNVGLDFGFFQNKFSGSIDYFNKQTDDMLLRVPVPGQTGIENVPYQNAGSMKNNGIEISLLYRNNSHNLSYSLGLNFSKINNKILSLGANNGFIDGASFFNSYNITRTVTGMPVAQFYGYKTDGLFQNDKEIAEQSTQKNVAPGDVRYLDEDKDGVLDFYFLGSPLPKFTYSFNSNLAYKGFDFSFTLQGIYGNKIFNGPASIYTRSSNGIYNLSRDMINRWRGEGTQTDAFYPRMNASDVNNSLYSNRFIESGSYLRIKTLQLGYNFKSSLINKMRIESLRLYINAQNLYTFTKYTGLDPEIGMRNDDPLDISIDRGHYPQPRILSAGVNIVF